MVYASINTHNSVLGKSDKVSFFFLKKKFDLKEFQFRHKATPDIFVCSSMARVCGLVPPRRFVMALLSHSTNYQIDIIRCRKNYPQPQNT